MIKKATGLLSVQKTKADERSPTQLQKDEDGVSDANLFFSGNSFMDGHNPNSMPDINSVYQKDTLIPVDNENFFDFLGVDGKDTNISREELRNPKMISSRAISVGIKKISSRQ